MFATFESVGGRVRLGVDQATMTNSMQVHAAYSKAELANEEAKLAGLEADRAKLDKAGLPTADIDDRVASSRSDAGAGAAAYAIMNSLSTNSLPLPESVNVHTGLSSFDEKIKSALKNPKLLLYKLQSSGYKFARALIPLSLPFVWLIFAWRREYKLCDPATFVTYSLSFVIALLVVMAVFASLGAPTAWALYLVPIPIFRQLQQAYCLS